VPTERTPGGVGREAEACRLPLQKAQRVGKHEWLAGPLAGEPSIGSSNEVVMGYRTPKEQYAAKLTTPEKAVETMQDGSTLCLALGVGMPQGLARAVADRILADSLKNLNLYYQHSMKYSEETLVCPEVLAEVDGHGYADGRRVRGYRIRVREPSRQIHARTRPGPDQHRASELPRGADGLRQIHRFDLGCTLRPPDKIAQEF
jgi:hypothetical protein